MLFILQLSHTASSCLLVVYVRCKINNIAKVGSSANNGPREMEFGLLDGGKDTMILVL